MERLTKWGNGHAYYPRCFKEPCYGSGCKIKDCPFETAVCERLAAYEDTGLTPDQVVNAKNIIDLAFADDTSKAERIRKLLAADDEGRVVVLPCKVGHRVFALLDTDKHISECEVKQIGLVCSGVVDRNPALAAEIVSGNVHVVVYLVGFMAAGERASQHNSRHKQSHSFFHFSVSPFISCKAFSASSRVRNTVLPNPFSDMPYSRPLTPIGSRPTDRKSVV